MSCEWDGAGGRGCGSGDAAGAGLLCAGEPRGGCADGVRCGAGGRVCAECAAVAVGGSGVVLGVCEEEFDEGRGFDDGAPAMVQSQVRTLVEATVQLEFESWESCNWRWRRARSR